MFAIISGPKLVRRTVVMAVVGLKLFMAAFCWEGFSFIAESAGADEYSVGYFFSTGIGTCLGVFFANQVILFLLKIEGNSFWVETEYGILVSVTSGLGAGTLWQVMVNVALANSMTFSQGLMFVFIVSFCVDFALTVLGRQLNTWLPSEYRWRLEPPMATIAYDFQIASVVASADAFFVGTANAEFRDGKLPGFAVVSSTNAFVAMLLAGSSGLCGYLVAQSLMNVFYEFNWADEAYPENCRIEAVCATLSTCLLTSPSRHSTSGCRQQEQKRETNSKLDALDQVANVSSDQANPALAPLPKITDNIAVVVRASVSSIGSEPLAKYSSPIKSIGETEGIEMSYPQPSDVAGNVVVFNPSQTRPSNPLHQNMPDA